MATRFTYVLLSFLLLALSAKAQLKFKSEGIASGSLQYWQPDPGVCGTVEVKGVEDRSGLRFKVSLGYNLSLKNLIEKGATNLLNSGKLIKTTDLFPAPADKAVSLILNFEKYNIIQNVLKTTQELIPEVECNFHILHCSGNVSSYLVTANSVKATSKLVSGGVDFVDKIEIVSQRDTVIELPIEVSAALVAGQTFCEPETSKGIAGAELTATVGGFSASINDSLVLENGEFLKQADISKRKVVRIAIKKGKTTLDFTIQGKIYAQSIVKGISKLNAIACGSNAGAIAEHSLIVKGFTGVNGGSVPEGITIKGLITGTDYVGKAATVNCTNFDAFKVETTSPTCGQANGEAKLVADNQNDLNFEWSNGSRGRAAYSLTQGGHFVIVRNAAGCYKSFPFQLINQSDAPIVNVPAEALLASGDTVIIDASTPLQNDLQYQWSTGQKTASIALTKPGTYYLTVKNSANCFVYKTVKIIEKTGFWISEGNIKTDKGLFYDDGGPDKDYSANQNRVSTLCPATKGKYVVLKFEQVNIFNCNRQDILQVFDGSNTYNVLNANLNSPEQFVASSSSDGCLTVVFSSHESDISAAGWQALISTTDLPPAGNLQQYRSCNIDFVDSGGKQTDYKNGEFKIYQFCPPDTTRRNFSRINFAAVQLAAGDHLSVYDGRGTNSLLAATTNGGEVFTATENSDGCLTVVFTSDAQNTGRGWEALVSCSSTPGSTKLPFSHNPEPTNTCETAPLVENYGSYKGVTSSKYGATYSGNLVRDFCGKIDNNAFYRFISDGTALDLEYSLAGGIASQCKGVQISVLKADGDCGQPTTQWTFLTCVVLEGAETQHVTVPKLIAGQEYFIMIDGSYGSTCEYTLTPKSGIRGLKLAIGKETITCQEDGSYFVEFALTGPTDNRNYRVIEKNNYYGEFKEVVFVNNSSVRTIKYGPYKSKRPYHILIQEQSNTGVGALEVTGESPCRAVVCKMQTSVNTVCYDNSEDATVTIDLTNATLPLSIAGPNYSNLILPDGKSAEKLIFTLPKSILKGNFEVTLTDANLCSNKRLLEEPVCQDCPSDFVLYPNPVTASEIQLTYPCSGFSLAIYSVTGQLLSSSPAITANSFGIYTVDIGTLQTGVYFLQLKKGKSVSAKRFIKL